MKEGVQSKGYVVIQSVYVAASLNIDVNGTEDDGGSLAAQAPAIGAALDLKSNFSRVDKRTITWPTTKEDGNQWVVMVDEMPGGSLAAELAQAPVNPVQADAARQKYDHDFAVWQTRVAEELQRRTDLWKKNRNVSSGRDRVDSKVVGADSFGGRRLEASVQPGHRLTRLWMKGVYDWGNSDYWLSSLGVAQENDPGRLVARVGDQSDDMRNRVAKDLALAPDEYITRVEVRSGRFLDYIYFWTNKRSPGDKNPGSREPFGDDPMKFRPNGHDDPIGNRTEIIDVPEDMRVVGIVHHGEQTELHNFSLIYEPIGPAPTRADVERDIPAPPKP